jgi:GT2 family glycosyltransferase
MNLAVAIPSYRNVENLRACLLSIELHTPQLASRITVCDDSGDGGIASQMTGGFPSVRWIIHDRNEGFGRAANDAILACDADIVILLNNDVELLTDPTPALQSAFVDASLFAVTFRSLDSLGALREGAKRLVWPMGFPKILHNEKDQALSENGIITSAYAVGGHAAFHRQHFAELGGFDPLFDPFYWEDVDLCQRARAKGWKTIYLPQCEVRHAGHSAIRAAYHENTIREMTARNRLLFAWRHLPKSLVALHGFGLAARLTASLFTADRPFIRSFMAARKRRSSFP